MIKFQQSLLVIFILFASCKAEIPKEQLFYWENTEVGINVPGKSILEFNTDTIHVFDFPSFAAGNMLYNIAVLESRKRAMLRYKIIKTVSVSMNTGQVFYYHGFCDQYLELAVVDKDVVHRTFKGGVGIRIDKGRDLPEIITDMNYLVNDSLQNDQSYKTLKALENFEDSTKLLKCN